MKTIPLSMGMVALVDDSDFDWLNQWKWCAAKGGYGGFYVQRNALINGRWKRIKMHNVILRCCGVDHRNGNGLDNQRANLRPATQAQNCRNQRKRKNSQSPFKGVTLLKGKNRWMAQITVNYRHIYIGCFKTPLAAAVAYDAYSRKLHGEFSSPNFTTQS